MKIFPEDKHRGFHLVSILMLICFCGGIVITKTYYHPKPQIVTVEKQLPFCPLTNEMIVMASYIKQQNPASPTTVIAKIAYEVYIKAKERHLPPELLLGIIQVESQFNPYAISSKGAKGLMQVLMTECEDIIDTKYIHDIGYNIECGSCLLVGHLKAGNGNLSNALFRYVGGDSGYVDKVYRSIGEFILYKSSIDLKAAKEIVFKADIAMEGK